MERQLKVLISAYACGPKWGSEIGMGWNWIIHLSEFCQLTVITESDFKNGIEQSLPALNLKFVPRFCYIDIGKKGRKMFWKQGSFLFYSHYKQWQLKAYELALELLKDHEFDLIHQLNMIGYREPGYLWKISDIPYIIGPIGGYEQFPIAYLSLLNFRDKGFYLLRSLINSIQSKFLIRPKKAYRRANFVIAATNRSAKSIYKYSTYPPILFTETGASQLMSNTNKKRLDGLIVNLVWCGRLNGRKGLPIALKSIYNANQKEKLHLHVIGDGPNLERSKKLADKLGLRNITWYGKISNEMAKKIIGNADILFFTSLLDATSTVIFEALEAQTPVLCHDTCGFGQVINDECGIKIPLINLPKSIKDFSIELDEIVANPQRLEKLKSGCSIRINDFLWKAKAKQLCDLYMKCY